MGLSRNVETKARVVNDEVVLELMKQIADGPPEVIDQADYFFNVPKGRLKMRFLKNVNQWELIYYERPNSAGPKLSNFRKTDVSDGPGLLEVLRASLGVKGEVIKRRLLFMRGQTRIHFDVVEKLGTFMELEVMLRDDQSVEEGSMVASDIMEKLKIPAEDHITCAYMDLLAEKS